MAESAAAKKARLAAEAAATNGDPGAVAGTPDVTASSTDAGGSHFAVSVTADDGEVTFSRPGVEEQTFTVSGGQIATTKDRADWLVRYAGANPVPDKE